MFGAAAALGMTACTGDFEDINTNPNKMDFGKIYAVSSRYSTASDTSPRSFANIITMS